MNLLTRNLVRLPAVLLCLTTSVASVIDDFSAGPLTLTANDAGQSVLQTGLAESAVMGGSRSVYARSLQSGSLDIDPLAGEFRFTSEVSFGYFTLQYGGSPSFPANLLAGGNDRFVINITELTPGLWRGLFSFEIQSGNQWFRYGFDRDVFALTAPAELSIPFSRFPVADLAHVQGLRLDVARFEPGFTIAMDSIQAVPEPAVAALCLLGLTAWARGPRHRLRADNLHAARKAGTAPREGKRPARRFTTRL